MRMRIVFILFLIFGCNIDNNKINKNFNGNIWRQEITIHFVSNVALQRKCETLNNCDPPVHGFSGPDQYGKCHIYVRRPSNIDDEATLTLGHEILHCIDGKYHK